MESRGRFPELKDAADRALVALRGVGAGGRASAEEVAARLAASDDVVRPVLVCLGAGGAASAGGLAAVALGLVQKLFSCRGVRGERLPELVDALWDRFQGAEGGARGALPDEETCLRSLQALTTLMSCGEDGVAYGALHGTTLAAALSIAFVLHLHGTGSTRAAAAAALPIMVSMVMDRASALAARAPQSDEAERAVADAAKLLADLVALTAGCAPLFLKVRALPVCFGLELLDLVLRGQRARGIAPGVVARAEPVLRCQLPRLLLELLPHRAAFAVAIRAVRVMLAYIRLFSPTYPDEANALAARLCLLLTADVPPSSGSNSASPTPTSPPPSPQGRAWQRALALEALRTLLGDPALLAALYRHNDAHPPVTTVVNTATGTTARRRSTDSESRRAVLETTVAAVARVVQDAARPVWAHLTVADATPPTRARVIEQLQVPLPPAAAAAASTSPDSLAAATSPTASPLASSGRLGGGSGSGDGSSSNSSSSDNSSTDGPEVRPTYLTALALAVLLAVVDAMHQATAEDGKKEEDEDRREEMGQVAGVTWTSLLGGLGTALEHTLDEGVAETVLRAYKTMVGVLGVCGQGAASDAFLASLARFTNLSVLMSSLPPLTLSVLTTASAATSPAFAVLFRHLEAAGGKGLAVVSVLENGERVRRRLARKGVLALTTVFSTVHAACGTLRAGGWHTVLQTLEFVQAVVAAYGVAAVFPPDVCEPSVPCAALAGLFRCTVRMDRAALGALTAELCAFASTTKDRSASKVQAYFVARLFEVMRLNLARLDVLWGPCARLLLSLFPCSEALEELVVQGVGSTIDSAMNLSVVTEGDHEEAAEGKEKEEEEEEEDKLAPGLASEPQAIVDMQIRFFSLLKGILTATHSTETRQRVCDWTHRIVQSAGHAIDAAWPVVLGLLDACIALGDRSVFPSVLQVVQLAAGDCLAEVVSKGARNVLLLTKVVARFAAQKHRVNASLSATEMLWNIAAYVAKTFDAPIETATEAEDKDESKDEEEDFVSEFWELLTRSLCGLSLDERSDVRNSALSVLFRVATVHGPQLGAGVWTAYLGRVAQLLGDVVAHAQQQPRDESPGAAAAAVAPRAQWCRTVALAFEGACRVLKGAPARVLAAAPCRAFWARVCADSAAAAAALESRTVAEALLPDYVLLLARCAEGAPAALPPALFDAPCAALRAVLAAVVQPPPRATTSQCLAAFVAAATDLCAAPALAPAQVAALAALVDPLARVPLDEYAEADGMTTLQLAVHRFHAALAHGPRSRGLGDGLVVAHAARAVALAADLLTGTDTAAPVRASARQAETLVCAALGDLRLCAALFADDDDAAAVADAALAPCCDAALAASVRGMAVRFSLPSDSDSKDKDSDREEERQRLAVALWDRSMETFAAVADACLRRARGTGATETAVCDAVLRHTEAYLAVSGTETETGTDADAYADVDARNAALVRAVAEAGTDGGAFSTAALGARLVALLAAHAVAAPAREQLTAVCHGALLAAAHRDGARADLAAPAYAALMQRAAAALDAAAAPVPALAPCAAAELRVLLRGLARLDTRAHARAHLLALYPRLCRAVALPDPAVRADLADLLLLVGTHYLPSPPPSPSCSPSSP